MHLACALRYCLFIVKTARYGMPVIAAAAAASLSLAARLLTR